MSSNPPGFEFSQQFVVSFAFQRLVGEPQELADPAREVEAPVEVLRTPERRRGALRRRRFDEHVVVRDPVNPPVLGAEREGVADTALPDELLVEFADGGAVVGMAQGEVPAVGNRAARGIQGERGALTGLERVPDTVEGQAWLEVAYARARVTAGQHLHDEVELFARQRGVRRGPRQQRVERIRLPLFTGRARDQDLREDVERVGDRPQWFEVALGDGLGDHGRLKEVLGMGRIQRPAADFANAVARAAHALQCRRDGRRRLDEHDFIEVADVDAEF